MSYKETITKLDKIRVVAYIDYLNKFSAINVTPREIPIGGLCYFKNSQKNIFPYYMNERYILARLFRVYPSSNSLLDDRWIPGTGGAVTEFTSTYYLYVVNVFDTEEQLLKKSYLHGYKDVIDDNNYFSRIPLINEITHMDNGILSNSKVSVDFELNFKNLWDDFTLSHDTIEDKTFSILKMLNDGHENPER